MIDRRLFKHFDWVSLGLVAALAVAGAVGVYSATHGPEGASDLYYDHLRRLAVGFAVMALLVSLDYHTVLHYSYHAYALFAATLLAVDVFGMIGMGAQRWLSLGFVRIQPSEFFKLSLVLMLARFFSGLKRPLPYTLRDVWPTAVAVFVPFALVVKQPDLGTALIIAAIYLAMLYVAGLDWRVFAWGAGGGGACAAALAGLHASGAVNVLGFLREYQVRRIRVLLNPNLDPLGAGYHITQSKIAIGSGGLAGKGFLHGTQSGLNFLPQQHTDFIFSVICEEWGMAGAVGVIALVFTLLAWILHGARQAKDYTGGIVMAGVATILFLHFAINIAMTTGILPVVGIPLPLLSYGGSSVMTTFAGIGIVMSVRMRRFLYG